MTSPPQTIPAILAAQAEPGPNQTALIAPDGQTISFAALAEHTTRLGAALQSLRPRDPARGLRIGIALPNGVEISIVLLAATCVGTAVPFNPAHTAPESETLFAQTGIDALVVAAGAEVPAIAAAQALGVPVLRLTSDLRISGLRADRAAMPARDPTDIALLLLTSGSTGQPKRVPLTHLNVCRSAADVAHSVALTPADRCLVMWEQFHIGGLVDLLLAPLISGGSLIAAGSFDAPRFFAQSKAHAPTWYQAVPTTLAELTLYGERENLPPPKLRFVRAVAAALSPAVQEQAARYFDAPIIRTLGMTEAGPLITSTALPPAPQKPGAVGRSAGPELRIIGLDGAEVAAGGTGQVAIRGENVFAGYEDNPDANAAAFLCDWFLTGDVGYLDPDGDLFLTGRQKEQINRGGEKISPQEVDDALLSHPAVAEAATFAVPHATLGEDVACAVALTADTSDSDLRSYLGARLAAHKIPARIAILDRLPRSPVGKIDRMALSRMAAQDKASDTQFTAPATPNETAVAAIWCHELRLDEISVHQDFAGADGDSLSAVRILVALEARYGRTMPDDLLTIASTVHQMAAALDERGISPPDGTLGAKDEDTPTISHTALAESGVFKGDMLEAVKTVRNRPELKLVLDFIIAHATPAQASEAAQILARAKPGEGAGIWNKLVLRWGLWRWLHHMRADMAKAEADDSWTCETLVEDALLYSDPLTPSTQKTLIVGFAGDRTRLLMPTYQALAGLDPNHTDLLLLIDRSQRLFLHGLPAVGPDLESLGGFLRNLADDRGYARVVGLGTSAGSLAVLAIARAAGFSLAVSAAPAGLKRHPKFMQLFAALKEAGPPPPMRIVYADRPPDRAKAHHLQSEFPMADLVAFGTETKNVMRTAFETGEVKSAFAAWLDLPNPSRE